MNSKCKILILLVFFFSIGFNVFSKSYKKPWVAVHNFTVSPELKRKGITGWEIASKLENELVQTGFFRIVIRAKISEVMKERNLDSNAKLDPTSFGKIVGADYIVTGRLDKRNNRLTLIGKLVDVRNDTGEVEKSFDVSVYADNTSKLIEKLPLLFDQLASKLTITPGELLDTGLELKKKNKKEEAEFVFQEIRALLPVKKIKLLLDSPKIKAKDNDIIDNTQTLGEILDFGIKELNNNNLPNALAAFNYLNTKSPVSIKQLLQSSYLKQISKGNSDFIGRNIDNEKPGNNKFDRKTLILKNIRSMKFEDALKNLIYINDSWSTSIKCVGDFYKSYLKIFNKEEPSALDLLKFNQNLSDLGMDVKLWNQKTSQWYEPTQKILKQMFNELLNKVLESDNINKKMLRLVISLQSFGALFNDEDINEVFNLVKEKYKTIAENNSKKFKWVDSQAFWPIGNQFYPDEISIEVRGVSFDFRLVPEGKFIFGNVNGKNVTVSLSAYYILKNELTNEQYKLFCDDTGFMYPEYIETFDPKFSLLKSPVVNISYVDASKFTQWFNNILYGKIGRKVKARLPSECEYEKASRGISSKPFTWGYTFTDNSCYCKTNSKGYPYPENKIEGSDKSFYGIYNLAGNVSEFCLDSWEGDPLTTIRANAKNPVLENNSNYIVVKGGNYFSDIKQLYTGFRQKYSDSSLWNYIGFRIVLAFNNN